MKTIASKSITFALVASIASVFACKDDHEDARVVPPVDASIEAMPETGPADVAPEASVCTGRIPNYMPPAFNPVAMPGACSPAAVDAFVAACQDNTSSDCVTWLNDPANAACKTCVMRTDSTGPLIFYSDGTFAQPNEGGCLALGGAHDCGAETNASFYCLFEACGACPLDGGQVTGACYETVYQGDCADYANGQDACESTLTGPVTDCELTNGTLGTQMQKAITLFCGVPGDGGGLGDAGTDDGGDAGPGTEAGPGDAATGDSAPGDGSTGEAAADAAAE
jgi:hypothetical protein